MRQRLAALLLVAALAVFPSSAWAYPGEGVVDGATSTIDGVVGFATDPTGSALRAIRDAIGEAVKALVMRAFDAVTAGTTVHLDASWFVRGFGQNALLAGALLPLFLVLGFVSSALRRDGQLLARTLVAIPAAFVLTAFLALLFGRAENRGPDGFVGRQRA